MEIIDKVKLLAISRSFILKYSLELCSSEKNFESETDFQDWVDCYRIICDVIGFEYNGKDILPYETKQSIIDDMDSLFSWQIKNTLFNNTISDKVDIYFGDEFRFIYTFTEMTIVCGQILSIHNHEKLFKNIPKERELIVKNELELANTYLEGYVKLLNNINNQKAIEKFFGLNFKKHTKTFCKVFSQQKENNFEKFKLLTPHHNYLFNNLIPNYSIIFSNLERAKKLLNELSFIKPGKCHWKKYEDICIKILNFLFVPPFRKIYIQSRNNDGFEIRDAILPNNNYSGFWKTLKDEFNSKNIICEFKNYQQANKKDILNQLRIYLEKKSIGKFGFLLIRGKANQTILKAQRNAYEQSNIMILILNDEDLNYLLKSKAIIGDCDEILENLKTKFEINY